MHGWRRRRRKRDRRGQLNERPVTTVRHNEYSNRHGHLTQQSEAAYRLSHRATAPDGIGPNPRTAQ